MKEKVEALKAEISKFMATKNDELEAFRLKFISRKSMISELFNDMKGVAQEDRKEMGRQLNELKTNAQDKFKELIASLEKSNQEKSDAPVDSSLPC